MKKAFLTAFFLSCLFLLGIFFKTQAEAPAQRIYLKVKDVKGLPRISAFLRHQFADDVFSIEAPVEVIEAIKKDPTLEFRGYVSLWQISPEFLPEFSRIASHRSSGGCSPSTSFPWGVVRVGGGSGGDNIKVAVLDTGIYENHPDLKANIIDCRDTQSSSLRRRCLDGHGHGTHVAGTIAANGQIKGVAPNAKIMAIKVCSDRGWCYGDDVARGVKYAADSGAKVINLSLGGSPLSQDEKNALDYAISKGVLVVAAAGNSGPGYDTINYPAAYYKVMAVAATDSTNTVANFSSRGRNDGDYIVEEREVEVATPGVSVESTLNDGCYGTWSGTSMATPHLSGLAAKLWQGSAFSTRNYLQQLAKKIDIDAPGDDPSSGFGLPSAADSSPSALLPTPTPTTKQSPTATATPTIVPTSTPTPQPAPEEVTPTPTPQEELPWWCRRWPQFCD